MGQNPKKMESENPMQRQKNIHRLILEGNRRREGLRQKGKNPLQPIRPPEFPTKHIFNSIYALERV